MRLSATKVALVSVFAALQAILSLLPFTITIGVSGQITFGVIGGPLIGILFGPFFGGLAVLIGSLVGIFINPGGALFGILTVIPPSLAAIAAGFIKMKRGYIAGSIILFSLLVFYANPIGREVFVYTWLHIVAMIVAFSPLAYLAGSSFRSSNPERPLFGITVAAFVAILTDHMAGSALAMWYFSPAIKPEEWLFIVPVYPVERVVALALTTLIAVPVYYGLKRAGFAELIK
jgi:membrane-bound metal-dependent hydrolase YbcI (DUF457 family)